MRWTGITLLMVFGVSVWGQQAEKSLSDQVNSLYKKGQYEQALSLIAQHTSSDTLSIPILFWQYRLSIASGKRREARKTLATLQKKPLISGENAFAAEFALRFTDYYTLRRNKEKATTFFKRMEELEAYFPDHLKPACFRTRAFYRQYISPDGDEAWQNYQSALNLMQQYGVVDPLLKGGILRELGNMSRFRANVEEALNFYQQELTHYQLHFEPDHIAIGIPHYNIGNVYYELTNYADALDHYLACYAIWEEKGAPRERYMRFLLEAIGDMYWELEMREEALAFYDKSLLGEKVLNNDLGESLSQTGDTLLASGDYEAALPYYRKALEWREQQFGRNHPLTGACNNFLARAFEQKQESEKALATYQMSLQMLSPGFESGDWRQNPPLAPSPGNEDYLLTALVGKGRLLLTHFYEQKDPKKLAAAFQTFGLAIELVDRIRRSPISEDSKLYWSERAFPVYEKAIESALAQFDQTGDSTYFAHAFRFCEKSKAFLLLSAVHDAEAKQIAGVPKEVIAREQELKSGILEYRAKVTREEQRCGESRPPQLELWREKLISLQHHYDQFLTTIQSTYPDYFALKYSASVRSLQDVQAQLKPEEMVLQFFEGDSMVYVFGVSKNRVQATSVRRKAVYQQTVSALRHSLTDVQALRQYPDSIFRVYTATASELYDLLLSPIIDSDNSSISTLLIIPGGQLAQVPFESFLIDPVEARERNYRELPYLFKTYSIRYSPSATLALSQPSRRSLFSRSWLGIAPDYATVPDNPDVPLSPLRYNLKEVQSNADFVAGKSLLGQAATEEQFRRESPAAHILHIAAHAIVDNQKPALSRFILQPDSLHDGFLHTYELYNLNLKADLAVLSACNTGWGTYARGEGLMSLGRAFHFAGCPSMVTSLWTVDDYSTSDLMNAFYDFLKRGMTRDEALRHARLTYIEQADPTAMHPYFWSGFVLVGQNGTVSFGMSWGGWGLLIAGIIGGILIWVLVPSFGFRVPSTTRNTELRTRN